MSPPERHYGRYVGVLAIAILVLITINTALTKPNGAKGIETGQPIPPFAVPLAAGTLTGDADVATHANDGSAGLVAACAERGPRILNVCELYERGPVVLALFVDWGSCPAVLDDMQALAGAYPGVSFAAVAIKGERPSLRKLMREQGLTRVQVGFDSDGVLAGLYKMASCPQLSFVLGGGVVQSPALLSTPSRATLRARVAELVAASVARGYAPRSVRPPARPHTRTPTRTVAQTVAHGPRAGHVGVAQIAQGVGARAAQHRDKRVALTLGHRADRLLLGDRQLGEEFAAAGLTPAALAHQQVRDGHAVGLPGRVEQHLSDVDLPGRDPALELGAG